MSNLPVKEKLLSDFVDLKYALEYHINEIHADRVDLKALEKFLFEELSENLIALQYRYDELAEEDEVHKLTVSDTIDNWRITDPQEIEKINKVYETNHVFFEIERVESVELETRTIYEYIQVIGDGKHKYLHPNDEQLQVLESLTDREPDVQYSPVKE